MNEKFFDLKKSKQDRMINGSLKIFTENGYRHASTDEIVSEAGISKGLLFHYFINKIGLFSFLYEYSTRFVLLELHEEFRHPETDYFELQKRLTDAEASVIRLYPHMLLFLEKADREIIPEVAAAVQACPAHVSDRYEALFEEVNYPAFLSAADARRITDMLRMTRSGILQRSVPGALPDPDAYREEVRACLNTLRRMTL